MNSVEIALTELKEKLAGYIPSITDRKLRQLLLDIVALERAQEIVRQQSVPEPVSTPIIASPPEVPKGPLTRGDACVQVLQEEKRPMHIKELAQAIRRFGYDSPAANLAAILKRDSLNRFVNTGGNVYTLNQAALETGAEGYYPRDGSLPLRRRRTNKIKEMGITLKQAVLMGVEAQTEEFTPPMIYQYLDARFPKAAVNIHITSVAAILNNLSKDGIIVEVRGGRAGQPKVYRKGLQLVDDHDVREESNKPVLGGPIKVLSMN